MRPLFRRLTPYRVCLIMAGALAAFGLIASPLNELAPGLWRILMARGLLITDFIALGGLGAASMNAAISAAASVMLLILIRAKPNGALIMCVWLVAGFSFFGKTVFNSAPIIFGVWLYAKLRKEPFSNFGLIALLSSTLGPLVGEVAHLGQLESWGHILAALAAGVAVGFAMVINMMATREVWPFFAIGFALAAVSDLTLIALGAIGVALAFIYLNLSKKGGNGGNAGSNDPIGDILEDY